MYTYPDYLMHHGILGMKWGIRKKSPTDVTGVSKKKLKKQLESSNLKNTKKVNSKMNSELLKSKEYKDMNNASNYLKTLNKQLQKERPGAQLYLNREDANRYNELTNKYNAKGKSVLESHKDEVSSAMLKDLGYDDTKEGRDYIYKVANR